MEASQYDTAPPVCGGTDIAGPWHRVATEKTVASAA
jgi:hypothetical protein